MTTNDETRDEIAQERRRADAATRRASRLERELSAANYRAQVAERNLMADNVSHNNEAERSCIGAVFLDNRAFFEIAGVITGAPDFYKESHRIIWRALSELMAAPEHATPDGVNGVDVIVVCDYLAARKHARGSMLDAIGGPNYLARLSSEVPSAANVGYYATIVRRHADLRRLVDYGRQIEVMAQDKKRLPQDICADVVTGLLDLAVNASKRKRGAKQIDDDWKARFDSTISGDEAPAATTGIRLLDKIMKGGIYDGRSIYIGGLTKMGKTTLAIAIGGHLLFKHDYAIDWVSVEMADVELETKFLAYRSGVDMDRYLEAERTRPMDKDTVEMREKVEAARIAWRTRDIEIEVRGTPNTKDIEMMARSRVARLAGRRKYALIVDYLQNCHNGNDRQSEYERITEASKRLNGLSKDLNIPVFILFQFDKAAEKEWLTSRKMPRFSNLRGSSQAGNDANHFLILHRNWRDKPEDSRNERYTEILQDLSRHGNLGHRAILDADLARNRFASWTGDLPPAERAHRGDNETTHTSQSASAGINKHTAGMGWMP